MAHLPAGRCRRYRAPGAVVEAGLQGRFRVELKFAPGQFLAYRIVIQVFELALTQLTVEAPPEIMQFGGEGFQLHVDSLA